MEDEPEKYFKMRSDVHLRSANKLLKLCQDNGGCFIKVGQHIAALVSITDQIRMFLSVFYSLFRFTF
jgi:aarF domain-containing kinase